MKKLLLDDLLGKLLTHELTMQEDDGEPPSKVNNMSLKAKKEEEPSTSEEESEDDDDPFALVARGLSKIMKMRRNFKKDKYPRSSEFSLAKQFISNTLTCFECGATNHFIRNCPKRKRKIKRKIKELIKEKTSKERRTKDITKREVCLLLGVIRIPQVSWRTIMLIFVLWHEKILLRTRKLLLR